MEKKITGRLATIGVPALLLGATLTVLMAAPAFAATDELTTVIDNLRNWAMGKRKAQQTQHRPLRPPSMTTPPDGFPRYESGRAGGVTSLPHSLPVAKPETPVPNSPGRLISPGRSLYHSRPYLLRQQDQTRSQPLTRTQADALLSQMTPKDIAILNALDSYRYLDTEQIAALMLSSTRTCQMRLKSLRESSTIIRWLTIEPPGWKKRQSVLVLAERGARLLARQAATPPWPGVRRARDAIVYSAQLSHDLEANGFFIALAIAGAANPDQGLHQWVGEDSCRRAYRERGEDLAPDGWGRYLTSECEITFLLEWDRATASPMRISEKARTYVRHFVGRSGLPSTTFCS
jgi:Replication-relaxation